MKRAARAAATKIAPQPMPAHGRVAAVHRAWWLEWRVHRALRLCRNLLAVVLVHERRAVEAEEVGVGVEEAADVGVAGKDVPLLVLERVEVPDPDPDRPLGIVELDAGRGAGLPQGLPDPGHDHIVALSD